MSNHRLHESRERLEESVEDRHRALASLCEELEAVDWYDQRISATKDSQLRAILEHNQDEEKEHAAMVLEWLRRTDDGFDRHLRRFLFEEGPITESEQHSEATVSDGSLGIGDPAPIEGGVR